MTMLRQLAREYWAHRPMELAAALSYYTLLSLAPLVLMTVAVAGLIFDRATVEGKIVTEIRLLIGREGSEVVQTVLRHARDPEKGALSVAIGVAVLIFGATTVFVQLQSSLNRIWKVDESAHRSLLWVLVKERLLSLAMVLAVGFLLLVCRLDSAAVAAVGETALGGMSDAALVLETLNVLVSLVVVTVLFATIFKVLPDAPVAWRDVWVGAITTAVLLTTARAPPRWTSAHEHRDTLRGGGGAGRDDRVGVLRVDDRVLRRGAHVLLLHAPPLSTRVIRSSGMKPLRFVLVSSSTSPPS